MTSTVADFTGPCSSRPLDAVEINYRLKRLGWSQARLAAALAVSPGIVNNVIHGRATCYSVAFHIAQLLGVTVQELWPERYVFKPRPNRARPTNQKQGEEP